jgi:hypothetical protein
MEAMANLMIVPLANSAECIGKFLTNCGVPEVSCATACDYAVIRYREFFLLLRKIP